MRDYHVATSAAATKLATSVAAIECVAVCTAAASSSRPGVSVPMLASVASCCRRASPHVPATGAKPTRMLSASWITMNCYTQGSSTQQQYTAHVRHGRLKQTLADAS